MIEAARWAARMAGLSLVRVNAGLGVQALVGHRSRARTLVGHSVGCGARGCALPKVWARCW